MASEVGVLVLETVHVWGTVNKKRHEKAIRYARIHIDDEGNKTHEVLIDDKWTEVKAAEYHQRAEEVRSALITKMKKELSGEGKRKVSKTPEAKAEPKVESTPVKSQMLKTKNVGNRVIVMKK